MLPKTPSITSAQTTVKTVQEVNKVTDANSYYNTIPGLPVLVYNSNKIKQQLKENFLFQKYLPLYVINPLGN